MATTRRSLLEQVGSISTGHGGNWWKTYKGAESSAPTLEMESCLRLERYGKGEMTLLSREPETRRAREVRRGQAERRAMTASERSRSVTWVGAKRSSSWVVSSRVSMLAQ